MSENPELTLLLNSVENANSKKTYRTSYNKLMASGLFTAPITDTPNLKIISIIKTITDNPNNRKSYIIVPLKLKKLANSSVIELEHFMEQNKGDIMKHNQEKKETANPDELSIIGFHEYALLLYYKALFVPYIVNYLLVNFGVRTQDLDALIVSSKAKKKIGDTLDNYLIVYKTKIVYIRRKYKTYKTYGEKINIIKDKRFIDAVTQLGRADFEPLLLTNDGKRISETGLNKTIQRMSYGQYGEGRLFKLLVDAYKYDENKLKQLADNRGTSVKEILASYTNADLLK